ncbi:MAG: Clp protease ClpP [Comamonadaceae bacterium]|nr:MAG: Clp protease ClpP [Comamonadaceae bacterium]
MAKDDSAEVEIFLYDQIVSSEEEAEWWGGVAPESFVRAIYGLDKNATIHLRVNCPGGSVFAARAMEQALRDHKGKVVVHIDGLAASAATFIAMAGDEVVMAKGALFMIHKAWTGMWGNAEDLRKEADLLDKIDGTLTDTYAEKTGKSVEDIAAWMAAETWFTSQEALDAGFADSIAESAPKAQAGAWNLSAYENAPTATSPEPVATPEPVASDPPLATDEHRARQQQRLNVLARISHQ